MERKQVNVMHAVQYRVMSATNPEGQGIAIEFIVVQPSGELGQFPAVFLPLDKAEELSQAVLAEVRRIRMAH